MTEALLLFWPAAAAGLAIALACGALSVFVVLRRLAFVGHGISHAAFGGIGLAAALGLIGQAAGLPQLAIVTAFCLAAALAIGWSSAPASASSSRSAHSKVGALRQDTAIGVTLVASMAMGAILLSWRAHQPGASANSSGSIESLLFGAILTVTPTDAAAAWIVAAAALSTLLIERRRLLFWAFDEDAAQAFGVSTLRARLILMATLAVTIVAAMKLAGVILVTALLVIPGAAALRMSDRLAPVFRWSIAFSLLGVAAGLALSYRANFPPGPSVVLALVALLAASSLFALLHNRRTPEPTKEPLP